MRAQYAQRAEHEQEHGEGVEPEEEHRLVLTHPAEPVLEGALVGLGFGIDVARSFFGVRAAAQRIFQPRHARAHADVLVAEVESVPQVACPARTGEHHRAEKAAERKIVGQFDVSEVDQTCGHIAHVFERSDLQRDERQAHGDEYDAADDHALHRLIHDPRAEQQRSDQEEREPRPRPIRPRSVRTEQQGFQCGARHARPAGQKQQGESEEQQDVNEAHPDPREAGVRRLAGHDGPAPDLAVEPELQKDAERRGPDHACAELGGDPRPQHDLARTDGQPDQHRPRTGQLPEGLCAPRQIGRLERGDARTHAGLRSVAGKVIRTRGPGADCRKDAPSEQPGFPDRANAV